MSRSLDLMANNPGAHWTSGWAPHSGEQKSLRPRYCKTGPHFRSEYSDCSGRTTVFEFPGRHLGLSPRKLGLNPRPICMGYTVGKMTLVQIFVHYVGFLPSVQFLQSATVYSFIHLPPTIHNPSNSDQWRTQEIFSGGGCSKNSVEDRGQR